MLPFPKIVTMTGPIWIDIYYSFKHGSKITSYTVFVFPFNSHCKKFKLKKLESCTKSKSNVRTNVIFKSSEQPKNDTEIRIFLSDHGGSPKTTMFVQSPRKKGRVLYHT